MDMSLSEMIRKNVTSNILTAITGNFIAGVFDHLVPTERLDATCAAAEILNNTDLTDQVRANAVSILGAMAKQPHGGFAVHALMLRKGKEVITPPSIAERVTKALLHIDQSIPACPTGY